MKFNSLWYSERRFASMTGVTLFIGNIGSILAAGPFASVLKTYSWRSIFLFLGALSLILSALGYLFIRNRPEDFSFTPPSESDGMEPTIGKNRRWLGNLVSVMKVRAVWPGLFANFGITGSIYAFMGLWGIPFLRDGYHLARAEAAQYVTVMLVTFSLGGLFFGWLSDRIGQRKPFLIISSILYTGAWLALMYLPWRPGASGFVLFGFLGFAGTGCILTFACAKEIINPAHAGMATSLVNTGAFLGTLVMQPLFGWVLDHIWDGTTVDNLRVYSLENYHKGFLLMIAFSIISIVGTLLVKETYCKNSTTGIRRPLTFDPNLFMFDRNFL